MNATPKKKLCWNCEASVALQEENCPYCAVYLGPASVSGDDLSNDPLAPPYKIQVMEEEETVPEAPYVPEEPEESVVFDQEHEHEQEEYEDEIESRGDIKEIALPMGLLLAGTVFFLFGLILFLFSQDGVFTLHWNGEYWYFYQLLAVPMLYFGWRALSTLDGGERHSSSGE